MSVIDSYKWTQIIITSPIKNETNKRSHGGAILSVSSEESKLFMSIVIALVSLGGGKFTGGMKRGKTQGLLYENPQGRAAALVQTWLTWF